MKISKILVAASLAFASFVSARANSPFEVTATSFSPSLTKTQDYSSFPDLVSDVVNTQGSFASFAGTSNFNANVTFLGVANALQVSYNYSPTLVTVSVQSPVSGLSQSFQGPTRSNVETQVKNYFLQNGSSAVGAFMAAIAKQSAVAVTDGNPGSSTARMSDSTFYGDGFTPSMDLPFEGTAAASDAGTAGAAGSASSTRFTGFGIGFNSGQFNANGIKGTNTDVSIPFGYRFTDRVSLAGSIPLNYLTVEGAKIYGAGLDLALPVRLQIMNKDNRLNWRLTPLAG